MKSYKFKIRESWKQWNDFMSFDIHDLKNQLTSKRDFSEDDTWIETEYGYTIDLGWYGDYGNRILRGMIVVNYDWDNPLEEVTLKTFQEALDWVNKWIKKIEEIEDSMTKEEKKKKMEELKHIFDDINRQP